MFEVMHEILYGNEFSPNILTLKPLRTGNRGRILKLFTQWEILNIRKNVIISF